jgi:hypothetical protein
MACTCIDIIYTAESAAQLLGLSERVVLEKFRGGIIKAYKKYKWYTLHSHIVDYIKSNKE